jgi:hypothetical protein
MPLPTWLSNLIRPIKEPFTPFLTRQETETFDAAATAETKVTLGETGQSEADSVGKHVESRDFMYLEYPSSRTYSTKRCQS